MACTTRPSASDLSNSIEYISLANHIPEVQHRVAEERSVYQSEPSALWVAQSRSGVVRLLKAAEQSIRTGITAPALWP